MTMKKLIMASILASVVASCSAQVGAEYPKVIDLNSAPGLENKVDSLVQLVTAKAHEQNVPTTLAHAVISVESRYQPRAYNQGSYGIGQIQCPTARGVGFRGSCQELFDPRINLTYSMTYLRQALDKSNDDWCHAATLYNEGLYTRSRRGKYCNLVMKRLEKEFPVR